MNQYSFPKRGSFSNKRVTKTKTKTKNKNKKLKKRVKKGEVKQMKAASKPLLFFTSILVLLQFFWLFVIRQHR
ncbi:hypothetical protein MSBR2_0698 [Methanosarcina barkeri 227]|uniref:Uncharacterized protein n=1 Tax=Methanosarcina barkeri 227 TaxID=1434106 RepID=A0A0E3QZF5_METBA|nr:hypothetical protein MSBR2_0698 [Methanosarcina barkeri 227]